MDVLTHFVNDQKKRLAWGSESQHLADGLGRLGYGSADASLCASTAINPAHRVQIAIWLHHVQYVRKILFGELVVPGFRPWPAERLLRLSEEFLPFPIEFEL